MLTTISVLALVAAARAWRRHRLWRGALLTVVTLAVGVLTAADFVNAHYEYAPQVRDVADVAFPGFAYRQLSVTEATQGMRNPHGGVVRLEVPNIGDGFGRSQELVYLPRAYFTSTRPLPVVYLLHGSPGSAEDWFRAAHAADVGALLDRAGTPAVLVAPEMSKSWTQDSECVDGVSLRAETHFMSDVLPTTDRLLHVRTDRDGRVVAGNSAGGYCALNIGLRHRDAFATIVDLSGFTEPTHEHGLAALFGSGSDAAARARANTPRLYAPSLAAGPPVRIWLDAGRSDQQSLREETAFTAALSGHADLAVHLAVRPGGHTYGVWRPALRQSLLWAVHPDALPTQQLPPSVTEVASASDRSVTLAASRSTRSG